MRGLLQRMSDADADAVAALRVVSAFDELLTSQAPLLDVVATAAALVGVPVHVRDDWNGRRFSAPTATVAGVVHRDGASGQVPTAVPAHGAEQIDDRIVAPVSVAEGRIGVVWSDPLPAPATEIMRIAVERLAAAVAIDATRERAHASSAVGVDPLHALLGLTGLPVSADEAAVLAARCGLDPQARYVPVAASAMTPMAGHAVAAALCRVLHEGPGSAPRGAGFGRLAALVVPVADAVRLTAIGQAAVIGDWRVRVGVGPMGGVADLSLGWTRAREALAFAGDIAPVVAAEDLGVLALLADLPADLVNGSADVRAIGNVARAATGAEDLVILQRYCESGSLRETATAVHRHHSSIDYRVKKLQAVLGFSLDQPTTRMRALLALRLWLLQRDRNNHEA